MDPLDLLAVGACLGLAAVLAGCSPGSSQPSGPHPVRFVVEADGGAPGPLYVQVNTESRPVGWLTLLRDGESLAFASRCEVPRCGEPAEAVCGAAMPRVRELTAGTAHAVEYLWDGHLSRTTEAGCEVMEPAPAGGYLARVCYARDVRAFGSSPDPAPGEDAPELAGDGTLLGHVRDPVCVERPLTVPGDDEVRVVVPPR